MWRCCEKKRYIYIYHNIHVSMTFDITGRDTLIVPPPHSAAPSLFAESSRAAWFLSGVSTSERHVLWLEAHVCAGDHRERCFFFKKKSFRLFSSSSYLNLFSLSPASTCLYFHFSSTVFFCFIVFVLVLFQETPRFLIFAASHCRWSFWVTEKMGGFLLVTVNISEFV